MKKLLSILLLCFCYSATAQNSSTIQQLLDEGVTVGELLDAGITPEEFYGMEYQGGLIFDIDSILGLGKVVAIYNGPSIRPASINDISPSSYPFVETQDDGLLNTEILSEVYDHSVYDVAISFFHKSFSDWYIPSINEAFKIADSYINLKFRDESGQEVIYNWPNILTSEMSSNEYVNVIASLTSSPNVSTEYVHSALYPKFIRQFNIDSPLEPGTPALESFLETYTSPVVEEEVVSDANSFDVLNPLSYNGEFETVHHDFANGDYVVPSGKTFVLNSLSKYGGDEPRIAIDNIYLAKIVNWHKLESTPIYIQANKVISSIDSPTTSAYMHGILINKVCNTVHHTNESGNFIVPEGKILLIQSIKKDSGGGCARFLVNSIYAFEVCSQTFSDYNFISPLIINQNEVIEILDNSATFHGVLVDKTNYNYATDYELIDALNEGMDSLSTMSEVVVQENDSLTTENAILTEENEALMAIDYNYDSLQYVTEYLYSQVFDLQQELLVPNIDVDMAIGWNMIGFSCPEDKSAEDALLSIVDEIIIFKDNNGSVYMPEFGFNGIGNLTPGHGYQLKVTDYILDFNICE